MLEEMKTVLRSLRLCNCWSQNKKTTTTKK